MLFNKYNSIENSYQEDFIKSIQEQGYAERDYIVQEKVHGANLSFITDGNTLVIAKRTGLIAPDESLYNAQLVQGNYQERVLALYQALVAQYNIKTLTIFGELFGGGYPHPDVSKDDKAKLVQQGIYYCPHNDFYAFDILLDNEQYLEVEIATQYFQDFGFIHAKSLFKGRLNDCLAYPNTFKTTLPQAFGLPELDGNLCEGVVIRPLRAAYLRTGSRVLIKNKNELWEENNNFIDKAILKQLIHDEDELSEAATLLCEEVYKYITQNRLSNLISKIGEINPKKDLGKVLGLYNKDTLSDFLKIHQDAYQALEKHESKAINKFLNKHATQLINDYFEQ